MTIENHMVVGNQNHDLYDGVLTEAEEVQSFKDWYCRTDTPDVDVYEHFEDHFHQSERYSWMINGQLNNEFEKFKVKWLRDSFGDETGIDLTLDQVKVAL